MRQPGSRRRTVKAEFHKRLQQGRLAIPKSNVKTEGHESSAVDP